MGGGGSEEAFGMFRMAGEVLNRRTERSAVAWWSVCELSC